MFNNLINIHDILYLVEKIRQGDLKKIVSKVILGPRKGGGNNWEEENYPLKHWWDIPGVTERWNRMVTGSEKLGHLDYFFNKYLNGRSSLEALTLGCGTGHREVELARSGIFKKIEGVDFSKARICHARDWIAQHGYSDIVKFVVKDVKGIKTEAKSYDLILAEQSLHHFPLLEKVLYIVNDSLKTDGIFVFNEYVGPSRFQWTDRQLEVINSILATIPEKYRRRWKSGTIKKRVERRGRLSMILYDRTEAVESASILPLIKKIFDPIEIRGYGGSVLQLLFADIAHNFLGKDEETYRILEQCFEIEDRMISRGELKHDFVVGICKKRS